MAITGYHNDVPSTTGPISAPARSVASIIAIISALVSFYLSAHHHQAIGFLLALIAIGGGILGGVEALSPRVRGGLLSIAAVALGVIGIVVAIIAMIF
jgi:hypothetical protein